MDPNAILLLIAAVSVVFGALGGVLFSMWLGERARRRDLLWYMGQQERPKDTNPKAEVVPGPDPEVSARQRAEVAVVREGLREELKRDGRTVDEEELEQEALRLVTLLGQDG